MLMVDIDFHLDNAYEQYRSYTTPDTISDMLKMVLYIFFKLFTDNLSIDIKKK